MKKPAPLSQNELHNQQTNPTTIRTLRHLLAALANLQTISAVTPWEELLLRHVAQQVGIETERLGGDHD
ncbi:hypothetical protein HF289_00675 [Acidithiobacillus ferrooxidans]|uniref:hypothetical protein n=1 Tax=Acidithiobacillus ferrooxidans TaxID=920 RepID=UPI001C0771A4|nr:hypothetical protein [Acidithiobacillus ferrooxidans]MBU2855437.1 hypothetical protein [Acidithiobacillus ferrooxidans]MBU2861005.1 hypothetical protein [Acidithiobacillus ferrooxidans]